MSVTLRAALGFRRRMGPKAGLTVLRPLIVQLSGAGRGEALLAALECARELNDEESYEALLAQWVSVDVNMFESLAQEVGAAVRFAPRLAQELAHGERVRSPGDARVHYLVARVSAGLAREESYAQALRLASRPPIREAYVVQIVASMLADGLDPGAIRVASLAQEHVERASIHAQVVIARYRLAHFRGYKRVAVLDGLLARISGPGAALALEAIAEFADRQMPTPLEWDRLSTAAALGGDETKRRFEMWRALREGGDGGSALAQDAAFVLSDAALSLDGPPARDSSHGSDAWAWLAERQAAARDAYKAIRKLRRGETVDFTPFMKNAADSGAPALALCALGLSGSPEDAASFAESLVAHSPARRGWLPLANAAAAQKLDPLRSRLLERAFASDEPGADVALGEDLRRRAWSMSDAEEALALMSRARRLLR